MKGSRRFEVIEHLSEEELDTAINEAQKVDEARLVRRLCFVKNLYAGDVLEEAARRVGVSQANSSRWAHAWNDGGAHGPSATRADQLPPVLGGSTHEGAVLLAERVSHLFTANTGRVLRGRNSTRCWLRDICDCS
jgi:hypothetical protein